MIEEAARREFRFELLERLLNREDLGEERARSSPPKPSTQRGGAGAECRPRERGDERVPAWRPSRWRRMIASRPASTRGLRGHRLDFAEAYLVANAEASGVQTIASFDREIDRVTTVQRVEPS